MCVSDLMDRLFRVAMKNCRNNRDLAEDAVMDTMLNCLEKGREDFNYASVCVKNYIREQFNKSKRRKTVSVEDLRIDDDESSDPVDIIGITMPNQSHAMFLGDCLAGIDQMGPDIRPVMEKIALDWTADEIAAELGLPKHTAVGRIKYGRKLLRGMAGYGADAKMRGHAKYIGIRRRGHVWEASISSASGYYYLGHFNTASDAAKAYDVKARELLGEEARQNFPNKSATAEHVRDEYD